MPGISLGCWNCSDSTWSLMPPYPDMTACRNPPIPVWKFTAPRPPDTSVQICEQTTETLIQNAKQLRPFGNTQKRKMFKLKVDSLFLHWCVQSGRTQSPLQTEIKLALGFFISNSTSLPWMVVSHKAWNFCWTNPVPFCRCWDLATQQKTSPKSWQVHLILSKPCKTEQ